MASLRRLSSSPFRQRLSGNSRSSLQTSRTASTISLPQVGSSPLIGEWKQKGIIDDRDLIQFDTLHEMQVRSCTFFEPRNFLSLYNPAKDAFEPITYGDCK